MQQLRRSSCKMLESYRSQVYFIVVHPSKTKSTCASRISSAVKLAKSGDMVVVVTCKHESVNAAFETYKIHKMIMKCAYHELITSFLCVLLEVFDLQQCYIKV